MRAAVLVLLVGCAHPSTEAKAAIHAADLAVCRQIGQATPGDGYTKWRAYDECADRADEKARAK